jgi:D-lactate dehydrogenase
MDVIAYDVLERKHLESELSFMYVTFEDLLAQSDVISLHAPYSAQTHHLISRENMHHIKRGAYLINTARGGLVDTRALIALLENGTLAGAGLDVVEEEALMSNPQQILVEDTPDRETLRILLANQYLIDHPRVLIMPHNAFNTREARGRILQTTIDNIEAIVRGEPQHLV